MPDDRIEALIFAGIQNLNTKVDKLSDDMTELRIKDEGTREKISSTIKRIGDIESVNKIHDKKIWKIYLIVFAIASGSTVASRKAMDAILTEKRKPETSVKRNID